MFAIAVAALALGQSIARGGELTFSVSHGGEPRMVEVRTDWFPGADRSVPTWWFERRTVRRDGGEVYRWTTTGACPAAASKLDGFTDIDFPAFINRSDETEIGFGTSFYRLEGRVYYPGGHSGWAILRSNTDTRLAAWIDRMLAALEPCWTARSPVRR